MKELKEKTQKELQELLGQEKNTLNTLRLQVRTGQDTAVRKIRQTRKNVARILTLLK